MRRPLCTSLDRDPHLTPPPAERAEVDWGGLAAEAAKLSTSCAPKEWQSTAGGFKHLQVRKCLISQTYFLRFLVFLKVEITNDKLSGFNTRRAGPGFHYMNLGVLTHWFKVPS